jgi:ABC-type multidrug transport system ATPase subunit
VLRLLCPHCSGAFAFIIVLFQRVSLADCVSTVAESIRLDGDPLRQPASQLSGGMLRRLSLGIALIADPQVVLLDEPSTGTNEHNSVVSEL